MWRSPLSSCRHTWHHGSPFSAISQKIRKLCTTTSEFMEQVFCWSWVSDDNNFHCALHSTFPSCNLFLLTFITHFLVPTSPHPTAYPSIFIFIFISRWIHFQRHFTQPSRLFYRLHCLRRSEVCQQICNSCTALRHLLHCCCLHWHIYQHPRKRPFKVSRHYVLF
jgi:hypothetical protein